jgi:hypothetical protein
MQMLRTPAGEAADADILSPRPRGARLGWMFRPFAGRTIAPASAVRPAASPVAPRTPATGARDGA